MIDTPRTDELEMLCEETCDKVGYVESAFARSLERELIEAKADAENYRKMLAEVEQVRDGWRNDALNKQLIINRLISPRNEA